MESAHLLLCSSSYVNLWEADPRPTSSLSLSSQQFVKDYAASSLTRGCQGILVPSPTTILRFYWQPSSCASFRNLCSSKGCVFPIYWRNWTVRQGASLLPILYKPEFKSYCRELGFCTNPATVDPRHISVALYPDQHRHRATHGDTFHKRAGLLVFFCAMWWYCLVWEERGCLSMCCCFYIPHLAKDFTASQQHKSQLTLLLTSSFLGATVFKVEGVWWH